jgi:hypothetical protein
LKPAGKQRAQRQAFERCAQLAEHVLNTRALGEIAPFVRVFAEREQFFATIKVAADARPVRVFQWGRTYRGPITIWSTPSGAIAIMSAAPVGVAGRRRDWW